MLFSSLSFLYLFLPVVLVLYYMLRRQEWRNGVLLLASLFFYSWGDPGFLWLLLLSTALVWLCGLGLEKFRDSKRLRITIMLCCITLLLGILVYFKYLNFFIESINSISGRSISVKQLALPAGISFYTFQLLSYLFDLYRGKINCERSIFRFTLYISFFPQFMQGPIVRYGSIAEDLRERHESWDEAVCGMRRFITGLGKKVLIADNVALVTSSIYSSPELAGTGALWFASFCYMLQLYFDFSGYCDMAVGLGRIFGFHLPENFNYPYAATSITDFWRRWHITLSSWFRDYVYIPLGGNQVNTARFVLNILVVWSLTGLWHGASWNYVLWGLYFGILLLVEKLVIGDKLEKLPTVLRWLSTLLLIDLGWVLFNISDTNSLINVFTEMFVYTATDWAGLLSMDTSIAMKLAVIPIGILFSFPVAKKIQIQEKGVFTSAAVNIVYLGILAFSIMFIISSSFTPFLYFKF